MTRVSLFLLTFLHSFSSFSMPQCYEFVKERALEITSEKLQKSEGFIKEYGEFDSERIWSGHTPTEKDLGWEKDSEIYWYKVSVHYFGSPLLPSIC